jgi:hypothetical protein
LRFVAVSHVPIDAVSLKTEKPFAQSHQGDKYGRVFIRIAAGQELLGLSAASGYKPAQISIPCISKNQRLERVLVLEKTGR